MEEALLALLRGSAAVTALVPPAAINWGLHPQGRPWPGIVLHVVSDLDLYTLAERSTLALARVQIDCWAMTYPEAKAIGRAVRDVLGGYRSDALPRVRLALARDVIGGDGLVPDDPMGVSLDFDLHHVRNP